MIFSLANVKIKTPVRKKISLSKLIRSIPIPKTLVVLVIFSLLLSFAGRTGIASRLVPSIDSSQNPKTVTIERTIKIITPTPTPFQWTVEKVSEHETEMSIPADPRMSTADELFDALNSYRQDHNIPAVQKDDLLCSIAQNRANEQIANGGLDDHAGFNKYAQNQNEFSRMGEVLFGGNQPEYGVHIVEYGWDRSLTGHREVIQDSGWGYGCSGIAGYYAVFVFGQK